MALKIDQLLPSISQSLNGVGFLFGAGASFQAGYPLMTTLTRQVVSGLSAVEKVDLTEVLSASSQIYDEITATPNIEEIADLTIAHALNTGNIRYANLERRLRDLIVSVLLDVAAPNLDNHVKFFQALKHRTFGLPCSVWIFTTNYDVLFETAAAIAGVRVENGFSGATTSFFDIGNFAQIRGSSDGQRFSPYAGLVVKLVKLHGSLSWYLDDGKLLEQHPASLNPSTARVLVLPRRRKIMDTLNPPYDQLFTQASRTIGAECKYLISCGFSFGDEHINQNILLPALRAGKCRLTALCEAEPTGLTEFKTLPTFTAAYSTHAWLDMATSTESTSLWKFNEFAAAF